MDASNYFHRARTILEVIPNADAEVIINLNFTTWNIFKRRIVEEWFGADNTQLV